MVLGLAASSGLDLALTSTPSACCIAADDVSNLRTDAQMALGLATSSGSDLALTSTLAARYIASDAVTTCARMRRWCSGSPHRAA